MNEKERMKQKGKRGGKERNNESVCQKVHVLHLTRLLVFLNFLHLGTLSAAFSTYS